ncbi:hypothetical protein [Spirillospora sp. CA-294931]|uniref:hypothetical protein n=1 Tax=Spirillospora sp. CA-294931 TaxID=3240042 RepID=UPI003D8A95B6
MTANVEYGIRATLPGEDEPSTWPIGTDEILQRQRIAELLEAGARDIAALSRPAHDWSVDETVLATVQQERYRDAVLSIAQRAWEQHGDTVDAVLRSLRESRRAPVEAQPAAARACRAVQTEHHDALRTLLGEFVAEAALFSRLAPDERLDALVTLLGELTHQEQAEAREVAAGGPDEDDEAIRQDAERRVIEAADAVVGGAR